MANKNEQGAPSTTPAPARALGFAIVAVIVAVLAHRFIGSTILLYAEIAAMAVVMAITAPRFRFRELYLGGLSVALTVAVVWTIDAPGAAIIAALGQASFLMAFILLLTLLHETAARSATIADCGAYLTKQPAGRRYGALFWGTNVMAVLFNLGIVSLLTPLVQKGVKQRALPAALSALSERRQINALLRGFAFNVVWSPTALAPLAILELIDGIDRQKWTIFGVILTAIVFLGGWIEDRIRARRILAGQPPATDRPLFPAKAAGGFLAVVTSLFAMIWAISWATNETIAAGLMLACPLLAAIWLRVQNDAAKPAVAALGDIIANRLPRVAEVAVTLAFSGYLGRIAAELTPGAEIADALGLYDMPDWTLLAGLPLVLALCSFAGVSPIMLAVFFGSLFGSLETLPADPTMIALAISCGWAMAMLVSPFATVVMLLAQQTETRGLVVSLGRNMVHAIVALATMAAFFWVVETAGLR